MGRQESTWKNEEGAFSLSSRQGGELLKKRARNRHHLPERGALRLARHAIIQITDSISLSVMCKCDLISPSLPLLSHLPRPTQRILLPL